MKQDRETRLRALIEQWRKMTQEGAYGVAAGLDINLGRAATIASIHAFKTCADQLEQVLDQE